MAKTDGRNERRTSRRGFVRQGALLLAGSALGGGRLARPAPAAGTAAEEPSLRIGLATDVHHADKPAAGTRHYRETLTKFAEASQRFEEAGTDLVVELGDFIDAADSLEAERRFLRRITEAFAATPGQHHYVLGNHCVHTLRKPEFLEIVGQEESYYSFDAGGWHLIVLDACFRSDGTPYGRKNFEWTDPNLPPAEVEWLRSDLERTPHQSMVFIHQRLDVGGHYGVKNAPEVRGVLETSGKVKAVFQGHYHRNDHKEIGGIHYCTLAAMVEGSGLQNNAYAVMDALPDGAIRVRGFRRQESYRWSS